MTPNELIHAAKTMHPGLAICRLEMARRDNYVGKFSKRGKPLPGLHTRLTAAQVECLARQAHPVSTPLSSVDRVMG